MFWFFFYECLQVLFTLSYQETLWNMFINMSNFVHCAWDSERPLNMQSQVFLQHGVVFLHGLLSYYLSIYSLCSLQIPTIYVRHPACASHSLTHNFSSALCLVLLCEKFIPPHLSNKGYIWAPVKVILLWFICWSLKSEFMHFLFTKSFCVVTSYLWKFSSYSY